MSGYKSSKEIYSKSQKNLKGIEKMTENITETAASVSESTNKQSQSSSNMSKAGEMMGTFASSLEETSSLINEFKSSLVGLNSALQGVSTASTATNSLLATNLISLTQINSVITAFRADFLLAHNGGKLNGDGHYSINELVSSLNSVSAKDSQVSAILKDLKKAANYANKASNSVRSKLGNATMAKDDDEFGMLDKILGKGQQLQGITGLLGAFLPENSKLGGAVGKFNKMDFSSLGGLLASNDKTKGLLKPLQELGMDLEGKNDPMSQWLSGMMGKAGLKKQKKEREKDPNLVMSSLAPFADDIKDIVEFKVKALHERPTKIPEYATPVWVVNSKDQKNYIDEKAETNDAKLKKKRLEELLEGVANNTKDKYGRDLLVDNGDGTFSGKATEGFGNKKIKKMKQTADNKIYQMNHDSLHDGSDISKQIRNLGQNGLGILENFDPTQGAQGLISGGINALATGNTGTGAFKTAGNIVKSIFGSHKGGKKGKKKKGKNRKKYPVQVHHDETILGPNAFAEQVEIDNTAKVLATMVGMLSSTVSLRQLRNQLLIKYFNKEKANSNELSTMTGILGAETIKSLDGLNYATGYGKVIGDTKSKLLNKKSENMTDDEYWGRDKDKKEENSAEDGKEEPKTLFGKIKDKITKYLEGKDDEEKKKEEGKEAEQEEKKKEADEEAEQEIEEHKEEKEAEVAEANEETDAAAEQEISDHSAEVESQVEAAKQEAQQNADAQVAENQQRIQQEAQQQMEEDNKAAEEKKKLKEDFNKKSALMEKASKAKAWAIRKAGKVGARARKMADIMKNFLIEKGKKLALIAKGVKDRAVRIAKKIGKTVKRLAKKLAGKVKRVLTKTNAIILIEKAKALKTKVLETIKGKIKQVKEALDAAATVAEAPIEASKAIPVIGPGVAIAAGVAAVAAVSAIAIAAMAKAKKGKDAKIDSNKVGGDVEKMTNKEKKKADKEEKKKEKEKEKEAKAENNGKSESIKEKEDEENSKVEEELDKVPNEEDASSASPSGRKGPSEEELEAAGGQKNDLLRFLNSKQIKALESGAKSKFANLMLNSPKQAANLIFMLNNGSALLGFKNMKSSDLNTVEKETSSAVANTDSTEETEHGTTKDGKKTIWQKMIDRLKKKDLLSDDLGDEGYSEDVSIARMQNARAKWQAKLVNSFAKSLGFSTLEDDEGNAYFTTTMRKKAQEEALTKNVNAIGSSSGNNSSFNTASSSSNGNSGNRFDGSKYIDYTEDGTWSNGTTKNDIDKSKYFTSNNGSTTLTSKILNNNWEKYKTERKIDDTAGTMNNSSTTYVRDFISSEYKKMNKSFISGVVFANKESKNHMYEKIADSIKKSNPWFVPDVMKNDDKEKTKIKNDIKLNYKVDYSNYGLGKSAFGSYGMANDEDFLNASNFALTRGYKERNGGTYPQFFKDYLKRDGIDTKTEGSSEAVKQRLASGKPVILMGKDVSETGLTPYGSSPHYVVATAYDGRNIKIVDSESKNSYDIYNANKVLSHSSIKLTTNDSSNIKKSSPRISSKTYKSDRISKGSSIPYGSDQIKAGNSRTSSSAGISYGNSVEYGSSMNKAYNAVKSYASTPIQNTSTKSYASAPIKTNNKTTKSNYLKSARNKYGRGFSNEENVKKFWAYALGAGMSDAYIAGIAGNIDAESGFDPHIVEGGSHSSTVPFHSGGYGLIQWTGATFQRTSDEFIKQNSNYGGLHTLEGQIFWIIECATMSQRAASYGDGSLDYDVRCLKQYGTLQELNAKTPEELAVIWHEGVERSKYGSGDRSSRARKYYDAFAGKIAPSKDMSGGGTVYSKTCWSGDSRTEQMHNYFPELEIYAAKSGQTIDYFNSHYSEISDKAGYNIFCWYGVNGADKSGAKKTAEAYNKLAKDLKGKSQVFAGTIGHCPDGTGSGKVDGGGKQPVDTLNQAIVEFNKELLANLSSDVKVIDTYTFIKGLENTMGASKMTKDNLHYTKECSAKIKEYVEQQIVAMGGTATATPAGNSVAGVAIGDLYVTLEGYVNADDVLAKYRKGPDLWDDITYTEEEESTPSKAIPSANYDVPTTSNVSTPTTSTPEPITPEIEKEVEKNTPTSSVVQPEVESTAYTKNGTMYIVNNIEYGIKTDIQAIMDEFNELNNIQDDSLDVLNIIYEKLLKRKGANPVNVKISGYDYTLRKRRFV